MGMQAELIGIGPCNGLSVGYLAYNADAYKGIKPGTKVYALVAYCDTTHQSRDLADKFEVDIGNFETHYINRERAKALARKFSRMDYEDVEKLVEDWRLDARSIIEQFIALTHAGFEFFYLPNG